MGELKIIQGDDKHIRVNFEGESASQVESFYFSSKSLNITKHFTEKIDDNWYVDLTSEETSKFEEGLHTFDITAKTLNGDIITGIYNGTVCVHPKENIINE